MNKLSVKDIDLKGTGAVADAKPLPGDVVSYPNDEGHGHSSMFLGNDLIISAKGSGVEITTVKSELDSHGGIGRVRKFTGSGK